MQAVGTALTTTEGSAASNSVRVACGYLGIFCSYRFPPLHQRAITATGEFDIAS